MDAQRPRLHFVQLIGLPDQMPEGRGHQRHLPERIEVSLPSPMFYRGSRELHMGRELGDAAGPATVGFLLSFTGVYTWLFFTCSTH